MRTIRETLQSLMETALTRAMEGDHEGALRAAVAGKNICEVADKLGMPPETPMAVLTVVAEALGIIKVPASEPQEAAA